MLAHMIAACPIALAGGDGTWAWATTIGILMLHVAPTRERLSCAGGGPSHRAGPEACTGAVGTFLAPRGANAYGIAVPLCSSRRELVGSVTEHNFELWAAFSGQPWRSAYSPAGGVPPLLLRVFEVALGRVVVPRVLDHLPIRRDEQHGQAHIHSGLLSRLRQWLYWHLGIPGAQVPAVHVS